MNKKNNRKGFTIVELVIVIAVIALLATILVPTFGNVVENAQNAALVAEIKNAHASYVTKYATDSIYSDRVYIRLETNGVNYYLVEDGEIQFDAEGNVESGLPTDRPVVVFCVKCNYAFETDQTENGQDESNESGENNVNRYGDTHTHIGDRKSVV